MMPSTSKSNEQKPKKLKLKFVLKPKQQWQMKEQKMNWLELPSDVMANILYRVGVYDILENAQKVCTTWHKICMDPSMWRVIYMDYNSFTDRIGKPLVREMCKHAVDRSQGQLVDITISDFANEELLKYIADRSSRLRRLEWACFYDKIYKTWAECLGKLPLLEELNFYATYISTEVIETAGRCCPMLTTLKINYEINWHRADAIAFAIGKNLPKLKHLELIGHFMSNAGLQAILVGCQHLELLDLRHCFINLKGELEKKYLEKIKRIILPNESIEGVPYNLGEDPIAGPAVTSKIVK